MRFNDYKKSKGIEHAVDLNSLETYKSKRIILVRDNQSFIDADGYWHVYPIGFNKSQVYVVCPHCGKIHLHGRGEGPDYEYEGHRARHCSDNDNNGYIITRPNSE